MKKTLFFILCLLFTASLSFSQITFADYETINTPFTGWDGSTFNIVANADQSEDNLSASCAQTNTSDAGWGWAGLYSDQLGGTIDITSGTIFTMDVKAPFACNVLFKLEGPNAAATEITVAVDPDDVDKWKTMSFDMANATNGIANGTYDKIVLIFDANGTTISDQWFFDNIIGPGYTPVSGEQLILKANLPGATSPSINLYDNDNNKTIHTLYNDGTHGDESGEDNLWVTDTLKTLTGQNLLSPAGEGDYTWELVNDGTVIGDLQELTLIAGAIQDAEHDTVPDLICKQTLSKPIIDGAIDALWANYETNKTLVAWGNRDDATDFNATFKTTYDQDSIYFLFEVTDDVLNNAHVNAWERDAVNIYLDFNQDGTYDQAYEGETMYIWDDQAGNDDKLGVTAQADVTGGWVLEFAIAFDSLEMDYTPIGGKTFGLEFNINDNDGTGRELQASYFSTAGNNAYNTPSILGNVKFLEISKDATLSEIKSDGTAIAGLDAETLAYQIELAYGTTIVPTVTATATDAKADPVITAATTLPGTTTIVVTAEDGTTKKTYTVEFTIAPNNVATLSDLLVAGVSLSDFVATKLDYTYELPFGTTDVPTVTVAKTDDNADAVITATTVLPGTTSIKVTAEDGTTVKTYTIAFTVATFISDDATLNKILVDDVELTDFDAATISYSVEVPFGTTTIPTVSAVENSLAATSVVTQATELPGNATIVVTAQDETTKQTYTVSFTFTEPTYAITFNVIDSEDNTVEGAEVIFLGDTLLTSMTGVTKFTQVSVTADAEYTVSKEGLISASGKVSVVDKDVDLTVTLEIPTYTVSFAVIDADSVAIADAELIFLGDTLTTSATGIVEFMQVSATADAAYSVAKEGYISATGKLSIVDKDVDMTVKLEMEIVPDPTYTVTFTVVDEADAAIADAAVTFLGETVNTDANGVAKFTEVADTIDAAYSISKDDFEAATGTVTVDGADAEVPVTLISVGVNDMNSLVNNLYPNPSNGELTIKLANNIESATFELYDGSGRMIETRELYQLETNLELNVNKDGIYLIRITNGKNQYINKVIVIK